MNLNWMKYYNISFFQNYHVNNFHGYRNTQKNIKQDKFNFPVSIDQLTSNKELRNAYL